MFPPTFWMPASSVVGHSATVEILNRYMGEGGRERWLDIAQTIGLNCGMTHCPGKIEYNCRYFLMTFRKWIRKNKFSKNDFHTLQGTMSHRPYLKFKNHCSLWPTRKTGSHTPHHRVDRVLGFSPVVRIETPTLSTTGISLCLWFRGGTNSLAGEEVGGVPIRARGQARGTLGIHVLCAPHPLSHLMFFDIIMIYSALEDLRS